MHQHAEVWVPNNLGVEKQIEEIMAPFREGGDEEGEDTVNGFWDWWQIGGRWTGAHTPEYDPDKDPRNIQTCFLCRGTGDRDGWVYYEDGERKFTDNWAQECNGCNGCRGVGKHAKWPTQRVPHDRDVIPVSEIGDELECYIIILPNKVIHREKWTGKDWEPTGFDGKVKSVLAQEGIKDGYLVTVDYHS